MLLIQIGLMATLNNPLICLGKKSGIREPIGAWTKAHYVETMAVFVIAHDPHYYYNAFARDGLDRHARGTAVSGLFPGVAKCLDLLALVDVHRFTALIVLERRTLKIHAEFRGPKGHLRLLARNEPLEQLFRAWLGG
jgi:hypothetical protein